MPAIGAQALVVGGDGAEAAGGIAAGGQGQGRGPLVESSVLRAIGWVIVVAVPLDFLLTMF